MTNDAPKDANTRHGFCGGCGTLVRPGEGRVRQKSKGRWRIFHLTCIPDQPVDPEAHLAWMSERTKGKVLEIRELAASGELMRRAQARAKILRDGGVIGRGDVG